MAPGGGSKRKRPERQASNDEAPGRPSPHRPENLGMAQQHHQYGGARGGRGGGNRRGSRQYGQSPAANANSVPVTPRAVASPTPAAPPRDASAMDVSRSATPSQQTQAPSQPPAESIPTPPPTPYHYDYMTEAAVASWQESGRDNILHAAKEADETTASIITQELLRSSLDNRLDATEAGALLKQIISHHTEIGEFDVQSLFINTISLLEDAETKNSNLLTLVAAAEIDAEAIRQELDVPLLQTLSIVRSTFTQMRARKTTNILYRQANFNLLREETEGYAKLITEYFNTANEATRKRHVSAENAFQRIKALVGSFDLDVGRVLDITLDISANLLVRTPEFFVKFYRCSSWWPDNGVLDNVKWEDQGFSHFFIWANDRWDPEDELTEEEEAERKEVQREEFAVIKEARDLQFWPRVRESGIQAFYELGARKIVDLESVMPLLEAEEPPELDQRGKEVNPDRRKRINENRRYMRETGLLPPRGNTDAAQLLGFKLRFYASTARDAQDVLPENLIYLAALLIKIGFISLRDLYPHLYPADDAMADEKSRLEKEKAEKEAKDKPGVGLNALAMAGALPDDTIPAVRNLRNEKERSGGSTPKQDKKDEEAKEELPAPSNQKIMLLKALLLIGALPEALYILGRFPWLMDVDISLPPYLHRIAKHMLSKVADFVRPLQGRDGTQDAKDWLAETAPNSAGSLSFKPREPKKPTRWLGLDQVSKSDGQSYLHYYSHWDDNVPVCQDIEDVFLLCNTFLGYLGVKIGQDITLLGTLVRIAKYSLTEDWSESNQSRWLDMMRRLLVPALSLSRHNVGLTSEVYELLMLFPTTTRYNIYAEWYVGKTSRLPDMRVAFDHNRAEVKDVLRRVSNETGKKQARALAQVALASPGIVTMSMINQLESYSNFIPSLVECTRYFSALAYDVLNWVLINSVGGQGRDRMQADGMLTSPWLQALSQFVASLFSRYSLNPSPVLQYLASELRSGNSTDLEMFEQLLAEMGGIRSDMEFNDAQVIAMSGGPHLQAQIVQQLADKRHQRQEKGEAKRLIRALAEPGLIGQMLISIAQERQMYAHHESSKYMPLKVLGNNLDKIQAVFAQYLDVLVTNLSPDEFERAVPDVIALVGEFGLRPGIAFTVCRVALAHKVAEFDEAKKLEADEKKRNSQSQPQTNGDVQMQDKPVTNGDHATPEEAVEVTGGDALQRPNSSNGHNKPLPWHPILQPVIARLPEVSPELAERISIPFYVSFWTRGLQDVLVHTDSYNKELERLRMQMKEISGSSRPDQSSSMIKENEKKRKGLSDTQTLLTEEVKARVAVYQKTRNRISHKEKAHWFSTPADDAEANERSIGLLQECFLPRSMLSSVDSLYCFYMFRILHENGTPGFSTKNLLDQLFRKHELAALMFQCTAVEAQHFGRFLNEILKYLQPWHKDKAAFDKEAIGDKQKLPGFAKTLDANGDLEAVLDYEDFRRILFQWHSALYGALQLCFGSGEYMHIRNGIIVLKSVVQVFPAVNFMGNTMVKEVTKLTEKELRSDLKLAAMSLLGPLKGREKDWALPQAFRLNDPSLKDTGKTNGRASSARPETPKLDATAPEFKPGAVSELVVGNGRKESVAGIEDGEVEEEKMAAAKDGDSEMKDALDKATQESTTSTEAVKEAAPAEAVKEVLKPASKPSTPIPTTSKPPPATNDHGRLESSRPSSTQPSRTPHGLPTRPESRHARPPPAPPAAERSRYPNRVDDKYGRLDRPGDIRPPSRDHSPGARSRATPSEREPYPPPNRGPRDDRAPGRPPPEPRHSRDPSWTGSRRDQPPPPVPYSRDSRDRPNGAMGPPPSTHPDRAANITAPAPGPLSQSPRPPLNGAPQAPPAETQYHENPARLALIQDDNSRASDRNKDFRRDQEPRDDRAPPPTAGSGDSRSSLVEPARETAPRSEQPTDLAPNGPRRGRLSRDLSSQESSFGRLNGPQDVPSGPRSTNGPGGRPSRNVPPLQAAPNARPLEPDSPAGFRGAGQRHLHERQNSGHFDRPPSSHSVPTTPASESVPSVHPSRQSQVQQPSPIQTNLSNGPRALDSPTSAPPSGPRNPSARPPPSPVTANPPAGPASSREGRQRSERQRASINATLQGANTNTATVPNSQSVNFRGAATSRQPSMPSSVVAAPPEPPRQIDTRPQQGGPRPDLFQSRQQDRPDEHDGRGGPRSSRRPEDERNERHRSSRNPSRERRGGEEQYQRQQPPPVDDGNRGDLRDTRDRQAPRDNRVLERQLRNDDVPPRRPPPQQAPPNFAQQGWEQSNDRRGPRRDGPPDDGRRSMRGPGRPEDYGSVRREDERRPPKDEGPPPPPPPPPGPGGRKRRHDDVQYDESKRRRSGR